MIIKQKMNFPDFPLYASIKNYGKNKEDLTDAQKDELIELLKEISLEKYEIIYALIRAYYLEFSSKDSEEKENEDGLHYHAKKLKGGIKFEVDQIPSGLQHILLHFLKI